MSFTQRQKALDLLRKIREGGSPAPHQQTSPVTSPTPVTVLPKRTTGPDKLHQAVSNLFKSLKSQEVDADTAEQLVDRCIELFEKDQRQVETRCAACPDLADLRAVWVRQTRVVVEALDDSLFAFFEGHNLEALDQSFLKIKRVLQERLPHYPRLLRAATLQAQVA